MFQLIVRVYELYKDDILPYKQTEALKVQFYSLMSHEQWSYMCISTSPVLQFFTLNVWFTILKDTWLHYTIIMLQSLKKIMN